MTVYTVVNPKVMGSKPITEKYFSYTNLLSRHQRYLFSCKRTTWVLHPQCQLDCVTMFSCEYDEETKLLCRDTPRGGLFSASVVCNEFSCKQDSVVQLESFNLPSPDDTGIGKVVSIFIEFFSSCTICYSSGEKSKASTILSFRSEIKFRNF